MKAMRYGKHWMVSYLKWRGSDGLAVAETAAAAGGATGAALAAAPLGAGVALKWVCARCTLVNDHGMEACAACEGARAALPRPNPKELIDAATAGNVAEVRSLLDLGAAVEAIGIVSHLQTYFRHKHLIAERVDSAALGCMQRRQGRCRMAAGPRRHHRGQRQSESSPTLV